MRLLIVALLLRLPPAAAAQTRGASGAATSVPSIGLAVEAAPSPAPAASLVPLSPPLSAPAIAAPAPGPGLVVAARPVATALAAAALPAAAKPSIPPAGEVASPAAPAPGADSGAGASAGELVRGALAAWGTDAEPQVLPELLARRVAEHPDRPFVSVPDGSGYRPITYREFADEAARVRRALHGGGVRAGERVLFLSPNRPEFLEAAAAAWGLGAAVVPANPTAPPSYLAHVADNSKAGSIVVAAALLPQARALKARSPGLKIFVLDHAAPGTLEDGETPLQARDEGPALDTPDALVSPGDVAAILYTSGSTKLPKGVPLTHENLLRNRAAGHAIWKGRLGEGDRSVGWLGFHHIMGFVSEFLGNMYAGAEYVFPRLRGAAATPEELLAAVKETGAALLYATPSMLERMRPLLEADPASLAALKGLKWLMWGGAALSPAAGDEYKRRGVNIAQGYGLTETTGLILFNDPSSKDWNSLSPIAGMGARFDPAPEMGANVHELSLVDSPTVMSGYLDNPEETAKVMPRPGVFRTGDLFERRESGYAYIGRTDEVFKLGGGEKVNPVVFEQEVERDPRVRRAAVLGPGLPRPVLILELDRAAFDASGPDDLLARVWTLVDRVNGDFPRSMQVKKENVIILEPGEAPLPVGPKGNLIRSELARRFAARLAAHFAPPPALKLILVGGTFDDRGGRPSSLIAQIHEGLPEGAVLVNGGSFDRLASLINELGGYDAVLWFPNVPNDSPKIRNLRELYPDKLTVTSKRNHEGKYTLEEVASRTRGLGSDLAVEFSDTIPFRMRLLDASGSVYEETVSPVILAKTLARRLSALRGAKTSAAAGAPVFEKTRLDAVLVGGVFDDDGGRPVDWVRELGRALPGDVRVINGGASGDIPALIEKTLKAYQVIIWLPQVSEALRAAVAEIKKRYPYRTLISAAYNWDGERPFQSMINEALGSRSNLWIEVSDARAPRFRWRDPLSNEYGDTRDVPTLARLMVERLDALERFTRQRSAMRGPRVPVESNAVFERFLDAVKRRGEEVHALVHPEEGVNRFLGNASFRASAVFDDPSLADVAFVSRRNVDKRRMDLDAFVQVALSPSEEQTLDYLGDVKPSVDSPVQARLYRLFPNVHFMLHSHVYVEGAPFTERFSPCGSLEEVEEVLRAAGPDRGRTNFAINLRGHGSIIFASEPEFIGETIRLRARPAPEPLNTDGSTR